MTLLQLSRVSVMSLLQECRGASYQVSSGLILRLTQIVHLSLSLCLIQNLCRNPYLSLRPNRSLVSLITHYSQGKRNEAQAGMAIATGRL